MTNKNKLEIIVNQKPQIIETKLLHFYNQEGGDTIAPFLRKVRSQINFVEYQLREDNVQKHPDSSITIRLSSGEKHSIVTMNLWDSKTWGIVIGDSRKSKIGGPNIMGYKISEMCVEFCKRFHSYLQDLGLVVSYGPDKQSKRREENEWAIQQINMGCDEKEVFNEWMKRRKQAERPKVPSPLWTLFKRTVLDIAKKRKHEMTL